jgi:hypothetical protein
LETIREKIGVHFKSSKITNQMLCLKNEHFLLEKPEKLVFHKTQTHFSVSFLV